MEKKKEKTHKKLETNTARVAAKKRNAPRKAHVPNLDLIVFAGGNLPFQTKKLVEEHLKSCPVCRNTLQKIKKELLEAKSQQEAAEIMIKWLKK